MSYAELRSRMEPCFLFGRVIWGLKVLKVKEERKESKANRWVLLFL